MKERRMCTLFSSASGALTAKKQDRNALCKCKSGKKAKNCCGCVAEYFKPKNPKPDGTGAASFKEEELYKKGE